MCRAVDTVLPVTVGNHGGTSVESPKRVDLLVTHGIPEAHLSRRKTPGRVLIKYHHINPIQPNPIAAVLADLPGSPGETYPEESTEIGTSTYYMGGSERAQRREWGHQRGDRRGSLDVLEGQRNAVRESKQTWGFG